MKAEIVTDAGAWVRTAALMGRLGGAGNAALGRAMYREAQKVMAQAVPITPFELGNLAASGQVSLPYEEGGQVIVDLGFGDTATPYAIRQHEELDYRHAAGRQAKFLEQPMLEAVGGMDTRIARWIERLLGEEVGHGAG